MKLKSAIEKECRRLIEPFQYYLYLIPRVKIRQFQQVKKIQDAGHARVVFLVSSLPMWKFQPLFDILRQDSRFEVSIAVYPFSGPDRQGADAKQLADFFYCKNIPYLNLYDATNPGRILRERINPNIIFYPQPYPHLYWNDLDCQFFLDKLLCYIPYAALTSREKWAYKTLMNNVAWRLFYPSELQKKEASAVLYNKGKNIRITGEFISDLFKASNGNNSWKQQVQPKKKVIWAPHYSLQDIGLLHRDSFVWLHQIMLDIANRYKDRVQFSFKPHPRLLQSLYDMPEWGKSRADAYYRIWAEGKNTQLDTGAYIDLFKESDAMIFDSSSFSVEYHFVDKPALFTSPDIEPILDQLNKLGKEAILSHYIGYTEADIVDFIEKTVLGGDDPKKPERGSFYQKYLLPPNGQSVAENIYDEILSGLGWKRNSDRL